MQQNQHFHPVTDYNAGVYNTASGKLISLLAPTEEMIATKDIASALSKICRFGGHSSQFYSVAQHSVLVAALCEKCPKEALMHDAAEAYLGDVVKPLKVLLGPAYANLETVFQSLIDAKYGLDGSTACKALVKKYDIQALELEHEALIKGNPKPLIDTMIACQLHDAGLGDDFAWSADMAKMVFLANYGEIFSINENVWPDNPAESHAL